METDCSTTLMFDFGNLFDFLNFLKESNVWFEKKNGRFF